MELSVTMLALVKFDFEHESDLITEKFLCSLH